MGGESIFKGIRLQNDIQEREIYIKCPGCNGKVFDSGLDNNLK